MKSIAVSQNLETVDVLFQFSTTEDLVKVRELCSKLHLDFSKMKVYEEISPDKFRPTKSQQFAS